MDLAVEDTNDLVLDSETIRDPEFARQSLMESPPKVVLPFPGGPYRNRLRPDKAASPASSAVCSGSTKSERAAATVWGEAIGSRGNCRRSIAVYAGSDTGTGPT